MKKILLLLAVVTSGAAIVLGLDPGRLAFSYVDVGGHKLRMDISGHGDPVVVFEAGGGPARGGPLESWERVQPAVSRFTTAVSYDRAGTGFSEAGPKPRDARQVARELHAALQNAHVAAPYVLVGHSFGGPMIRVFAGMYPGEVCGLVLIDPTQEEFIKWNLAREANPEKREDEEWKNILASLDEAHESQLPPGIPVTLITAMGPRVFPEFVSDKEKEDRRVQKQAWLRFHTEWLEKIPDAKHIVTQDSGHAVQLEEPELVIQAVREVVEKVKDKSP
ncbi:MAG TPA: alpha/beta hydrolase [Verrucomicrobiae bacterium]|nr:alpha/beta hydrolase [Verrucomicrobiae bacterium]